MALFRLSALTLLVSAPNAVVAAATTLDGECDKRLERATMPGDGAPTPADGALGRAGGSISRLVVVATPVGESLVTIADETGGSLSCNVSASRDAFIKLLSTPGSGASDGKAVVLSTVLDATRGGNRLTSGVLLADAEAAQITSNPKPAPIKSRGIFSSF
jgi:hypothetical protein